MAELCPACPFVPAAGSVQGDLLSRRAVPPGSWQLPPPTPPRKTATRGAAPTGFASCSRVGAEFCKPAGSIRVALGISWVWVFIQTAEPNAAPGARVCQGAGACSLPAAGQVGAMLQRLRDAGASRGAPLLFAQGKRVQPRGGSTPHFPRALRAVVRLSAPAEKQQKSGVSGWPARSFSFTCLFNWIIRLALPFCLP